MYSSGYCLEPNGLYSFGPYVRLEEVHSTQDTARDLWRQGAPPGTVVTAQRMTGGRGRRGRVWHVPPGANVCLTVIAPLRVEPSRMWEVSLIAGLALVEALRQVVPDCPAHIHFPNDGYIGGRKVGGVLIETTNVRPSPCGGIVTLIGVGINVRAGLLPTEVAMRATSIEDACQTRLAIPYVENILLERLAVNLRMWLADGLKAILARWWPLHDHTSLRSLMVNGEPACCRLTDIALDGTLTFQLPTGETHRLHAAHIIYGDD